MTTRTAWALRAAAITAASLVVFALLGGCEESKTSTGTGAAAAGGTAGTGGTGGSGGGGGAGATGVPTVTISEITRGDIGPDVDVRVEGVVAMSHAFLVSHSRSSGSCLWGVFISEPGLAETAEYSGILALSYGHKASIPEGGTQAYCPVLGVEETGSFIPDGVEPGDILTLVGETDYFLLDDCATEPGGATVEQRQLSHVTYSEITSHTDPPAPHVIGAADIALLASPDDRDFHDRWGGVKVRIEDVSAEPVAGAGGGPGTVVGDYGIITLNEGGLAVGDKIYYRGYLKSTNPCHDGPVFDTDTTFNWSYIQGFSYLDYCTWSLQPNEKCGDFDPSSQDCIGDICEPTMP